jgi:formylglycine-generating enzyme required for sulfatase activity
MTYYYSKNGQSLGPMDAASLGRFIQGGELGSNDLVWREGWAEWRALGQVEEFAQFLISSRPATPPPLPGRTSDATGLVAPATQTRTFGGIEFVWCPPGTFMMGSPEGIDDDEPRVNENLHKVTLTRGFWIGKYPVTQEQWLRVMSYNPSEFRGSGLEAPVEGISWESADNFCSVFSRAEGIQCRLPSEAEWEYACRAGSDGAWCFGDDECKLGEYAWYEENSDGKTHPVGRKKPNAWGIHDMHGNVCEWCADWYGEYPTGDVKDPTGPSLPVGVPARVRRGGLWCFGGQTCRSAKRKASPPFRHDEGRFGFRVAVSSTP